jgi:hypothetical protein
LSWIETNPVVVERLNIQSCQDEHLQAYRGFDALDEYNRVAVKDSYHQVMRGNFVKDSGTVCLSICHAVSGHFRLLYISIQYFDEINISGHFILHRVVHEISQDSAAVV